jgi:hypothetical protein
MERRDVHADHRGDFARPQPLEPSRREDLIGSRDERLFPGLRRTIGGLTFNQSDD